MRTALTLLFIMYGIMMGFYFFGLVPSGSTSVFYNLLFNSGDITQSSIFSLLLSSLSIVGVGIAIVFGYVTKNYELMAFAPIALALLNLVPDWISIFNIVAQASRVLAIMLIAPLMIAYVFVIMDYWRGRD